MSLLAEGNPTADRDSGCEAHPARVNELTPSSANRAARPGSLDAAKDGNVTPSFEEWERANRRFWK